MDLEEEREPARWIDRAVQATANALKIAIGVSVKQQPPSTDAEYDVVFALRGANEYLNKAHCLLRMISRSPVEFGPSPHIASAERWERRQSIQRAALRLVVENDGFIATFEGDAPHCNRCKREKKDGHTHDCQVGAVVEEAKALGIEEGAPRIWGTRTPGGRPTKA